LGSPDLTPVMPMHVRSVREEALLDARRAKLKLGLMQLSSDELRRIIAHRRNGGPMVYDNWNYEESTGYY
jgi:hypothetical protein